MKPIHVWSYLEELAVEREAIDAAIDGVLESGQLILGPRVKEFEQRFAAFCGTDHGIGVGNGTDALFLTLKALDIGPGDEVITVANTAVPTVSAIVATGAVPRFVDIDRQTYLMNVIRVRDAIGPKTRCVLPVHLFGQCVDMTALETVTRDSGIAIVEDCAQAHGAEHRGNIAGSMSDAAAFSFYPTKILGAYGDGGMVVTSRTGLADRLRRLRFYGMEETYNSVEDGYNSRLDELHAAILQTKLARIDHYLSSRRRLAARYGELLSDTELVLPETAPGNLHSYYLYVVRHPERDAILEKLVEHEIHLNVSYRWPIHTMKAYRGLGYTEGDLPETERAAREIFSLPMYPALSDSDQDRVCSALRRVLGEL